MHVYYVHSDSARTDELDFVQKDSFYSLRISAVSGVFTDSLPRPHHSFPRLPQ